MTDIVLEANQVVTLMNAASGSANHNSDDAADAAMLGSRIILTNCQLVSIEFVWTSFNTSDSTITVQCSDITPSSWKTKSTATYTIPSGTSANSFSLNLCITEKYYRVAFVHGTNSAGTISCYVHGKTIGT